MRRTRVTLWDVELAIQAPYPWDHHDRERLTGELAVAALDGPVVVVEAPTGCLVRLPVQASDARSAASAAMSITERAGRGLGLSLQSELRRAAVRRRRGRGAGPGGR